MKLLVKVVRAKDLWLLIYSVWQAGHNLDLLESRGVKTSLRRTVVHLETPFCVSESYIFIFVLGDEGSAIGKLGVKGHELPRAVFAQPAVT